MLTRGGAAAKKSKEPRYCPIFSISACSRQLKDLTSVLSMHSSFGDHEETSYCFYAFEFLLGMVPAPTSLTRRMGVGVDQDFLQKVRIEVLGTPSF